MIKIEFTNDVVKVLEKIHRSDKKTYNRILAAIGALKDNPLLGKKMRWKEKGEYSMRVGHYRVIYTFKKEKLIIYVIDVGHRKVIYKNK